MDSKYAKILNDIESKENFYKISLENIRLWEHQSDMAVPVNMNNLRSNFSILRSTFYYLVYRIFKYKNQKYVKRDLLNSLEIIKISNAEKLLFENPVNKTPGKTNWYEKNGYFFNSRWLRYIYICNQIIKREMVKENSLWVDIGSYYGGPQSILYKYQKNVTYVMIDFKHQLLRSYLYLSNLYPDANHIFGDTVNEEKFKDPAFIYLSIDKIDLLNSLNVDLVTNFVSFGEMKREFFNKYVKSSFFRNANQLYIVNRFVSSPFFERTYDSDLTVFDYQFEGFKINYFDVFPIHHFDLPQRSVLGVKQFINASSSQFEAHYIKI